MLAVRRGFDMDGVLCAGPPAREKKWSRMSGQERARARVELLAWYKGAGVLLRPEGRFYVISARKETPEVRAVTERFLQAQFPGQVEDLFLLSEGRTVENVVEFKARTIEALGLDDFTEDNVRILAGCYKRLPGTRFWLYAGGVVSRWPVGVGSPP